MEKKDYSQYSYSALLEYLDREYMNSEDPTDYAAVLLNMNTAKSFDELMSLYNVLDELELFHNSQYKESRKVHRPKYYIDYDGLNQCLNENLVRLYKEISLPDEKTFCKYYINIRENKESDNSKKQLLSIAHKLFNIDFKQQAEEIDEKKTLYYCLIEELSCIGLETNGRKIKLKEYFEILPFIKENGYARSKSELYIRDKKGLTIPDGIGWKGVILGIFFIIFVYGITDFLEWPSWIQLILLPLLCSLIITGISFIYIDWKS